MIVARMKRDASRGTNARMSTQKVADFWCEIEAAMRAVLKVTGLDAACDGRRRTNVEGDESQTTLISRIET